MKLTVVTNYPRKEYIPKIYHLFAANLKKYQNTGIATEVLYFHHVSRESIRLQCLYVTNVHSVYLCSASTVFVGCVHRLASATVCEIHRLPSGKVNVSIMQIKKHSPSSPGIKSV